MQDDKSRSNAKSGGDQEEEDSKIFPQKLMEILSNEEYSDAISFLPHGKAFVIRNRSLFAEHVMPKFFSRKAKYSSFTRKLNRWNFVRVSSGPELGAYYHEFFLRDKPHLAAQMFCKNARSKLAMAADADVAPSPPTAKSDANPMTNMPPPKPVAPVSSSSSSSAMASIPPAVLAALQKDEDPQQQPQQQGESASFGLNKASAPILGVSNLQLLERQYQLMQEEHAQRLFLQQLAAKQQMEQFQQQQRFLQQQQLQQQQQQPPQFQEMPQHQQQQQQQEQANAQALMRMRQLMELRARQRKGLVPTNGRVHRPPKKILQGHVHQDTVLFWAALLCLVIIKRQSTTQQCATPSLKRPRAMRLFYFL